MSRKQIILVCLLFFMFLPEVVAAQPVNICDDETEWPPYTYWRRGNDKVDKRELTGAVVELLGEVFELIDLKYSLNYLPWKRCTEEVKDFAVYKKYEVFINGSFNLQRAEDYYLTTPIYETHQAVFYSKKKYPDGPAISKPSDINNFKLCGVHGYNVEHLYSEYGLAKDKIVDTGAKSLYAVLQKIEEGRCDILVNSKEPVYGASAIGKYNIPADVGTLLLPGADPTTFHIFVSKSSPRAYELLTKINQAILILQHNGVAQKIFEKYCPQK